MKKIIFTSLIIIVSSVITDVEYGKEITFDLRIPDIELTFQEAGALFLSISFDTPNLLKLTAFFRYINFKKIINPPGLGMVIPFENGATNRLALKYESLSNKKGTIWMNPSSKEIKINLNETYEWKYDFKYSFSEKVFVPYQLIYSIENAKKDAILEFKYNDKFIVEGDFIAPNPLKICQKEKCETGITTYDIKKGESYKIYIKADLFESDTIQNLLYLPSYSFHFIYEEEEKEEEEKEKEKLKIEKKEEIQDSKYPPYLFIIFIILGILLLGGLGLFFFLLCRKNRRKDIESRNSEGIKFELDNIRNNIEDDLD